MKNYFKKFTGTSFVSNPQLLLIFVAVLFSGCKKELTSSLENSLKDSKVQNGNVLSLSTRVQAGGSIQAAVDAAHRGSIILIDPGVYLEAVIVNKPGLILVGSADGVVIKNPGGKENGITVTSLGNDFVLKNVTIKNFIGNGVYLDHVNGFLLSNVTAIDNGEYGLFPKFCTNGVIDHCKASGHSDTGIYVGQSSNVVMSYNVAYENVNGLEVENSKHIIVSNNQSYNNVAGILVILLPGLQVKSASDVLVFKNDVYNNNHINFAPPGGGFESFVPTGVGVLVLGADRTTLLENKISDNNFAGVAVISTLVLGSLAGIPASAFADIEPNPDNNSIVKNILIHNGTSVPPGFPLPGADLLWDGSGTGNCWKGNTFATSFPSPLPVCL